MALLLLPLLAQLVPDLPGRWCSEGSTRATCLRDWLGSYSGWAAAVGALLAAALTLPALLRQVDEAKRQTDFICGEAPPTMDVIIDFEDPEQLVVRIVNWNRRTVILNSISIADAGIDGIGLMEAKSDHQEVKSHWPTYIRGWEDRSRAPHTAQFRIAASNGEKIVRDWPAGARAVADIKIVGARHEVEQLIAYLAPS